MGWLDNGRYFEIIDGEIHLQRMSGISGEVYIPKYVTYNGERREVVAVGGRREKSTRTIEVPQSDKRRKPESKVIEEWHDCTISGHIFDKQETVTSIVFPDTVKVIYRYAFRYFTALESVKFSNSIQEIGYRAFFDCHKLTDLVLPNSLKIIGEEAFSKCFAIEELDIPDSVTEIKYYAFHNCKALKTVKIGRGITKIETCAFAECASLTTIDIYNDPFEVNVAPDAFPANAKVNYLGKNAATKNNVKAEKPKEEPKEEKTAAIPVATIDLDKLIEAVVADGVITDKERAVIIKKAVASGYDADEVEILLDGKLAEKLSQSTPKPEVSKPEAKKEQKTVTAEEDTKTVSKTKIETDDDNDNDEKSDVPWAELLWTPVKEQMTKHGIKCPKPSDRDWMVYKVKSIDAQIVPWYRSKENRAGVVIETYGGDEVKAVIENMLANLPEDNPYKHAELSQGKRNKDKWNWTVSLKIDKNDSNIVQWYVDNLLNAYKALGEI